MSAPSLQLFPAPLPSLTPTILRDANIAGGRYQGQQGLGPEQLTSLRGEAAMLRLRRGYRLTHALRPRREYPLASSVVLHYARRC